MRVFDIMLFAIAEGSAAVDAFVLCHVLLLRRILLEILLL